MLPISEQPDTTDVLVSTREVLHRLEDSSNRLKKIINSHEEKPAVRQTVRGRIFSNSTTLTLMLVIACMGAGLLYSVNHLTSEMDKLVRIVETNQVVIAELRNEAQRTKEEKDRKDNTSK